MRTRWQPILHTRGRYEISDTGFVRRTTGGPGWKSGRLLSLFRRADYLHVNLSLGNRTRRKRCRVHRLVLEAFIGPCPKSHEANHLNGIKSDNRIENLEWVTRSENTLHAVRVLKRPWSSGPRNSQAKVVDWVLLKELRDSGMTQAQAATVLEISREVVNRFENGRHWSQRV